MGEGIVLWKRLRCEQGKAGQKTDVEWLIGRQIERKEAKPAVGVSGVCNGLGKWRKGGEEEELGWCGNSPLMLQSVSFCATRRGFKRDF